MIMAMLVILMIQLQSFSRLALTLLTAPLGLIGATAGLLASGMPFGFVTLLGLIALGGMIIRNTVILVDQIEHDVAAGSTRRAAIIDSTVRRARPVVLTALAAILAMIPLSRSGFWGSMAVTIMGGLLVATVLTILFLPALYALAFRRSLDTSGAEASGKNPARGQDRDVDQEDGRPGGCEHPRRAPAAQGPCGGAGGGARIGERRCGVPQ